MKRVTVIKRDHRGREVLRYEGREITRDATSICIAARFEHPAVEIGGFFVLNDGDHLREWFYTDRYYNVFRIHDGATDRLKGWYCNITRPAQISAGTVSADDLALDVVVLPDRSLHLLDEDEYNALPITPMERDAVRVAVQAIGAEVRARRGAFEEV
ncbi:MAG: DUF402 domain-containing protein [Anaerolineaceae bacterium]|nr:MAG: DUF402 domain-containing protein [Anaerolineaceae bacterium]